MHFNCCTDFKSFRSNSSHILIRNDSKWVQQRSCLCWREPTKLISVLFFSRAMWWWRWRQIVHPWVWCHLVPPPQFPIPVLILKHPIPQKCLCQCLDFGGHKLREMSETSGPNYLLWDNNGTLLILPADLTLPLSLTLTSLTGIVIPLFSLPFQFTFWKLHFTESNSNSEN